MRLNSHRKVGGLTFGCSASIHTRYWRLETPARVVSQKTCLTFLERFNQSDSSNARAHDGLGLCVAIVDYLVRQQAGSVYVESDGAGKGATFIVEFPLTSSEVITSDLARVDLFSDHARSMLDNSETFAEQKLKDLRILVVED